MKRLKRSFWAKAAVAVASIAIAIGVIGGISFASNNQPFWEIALSTELFVII